MNCDRVAQEHGLQHMEVDFQPFTELTIKWERSLSGIKLHMSDYLEDAPAEVIEGMAGHVLDRICGGDRKPYPDVVMNYLVDMMADMDKVNRYIERHGENTGIEHLPGGGLLIRGTAYRLLYSSIFLVAFSDEPFADVASRLNAERDMFIKRVGE